jgi:hypothetical protein
MRPSKKLDGRDGIVILGVLPVIGLHATFPLLGVG